MTRKIKLMQITHDLAIGGLQQVVVNICRSIDRNKFDVSVLCLRDLGEFTPEIEKLGIKVFLLPKKEKVTDYLSFLKVAKILKEEQVDIIHTHNTQPFIDGTIAALLSGVKTIIHTDHARNFPDKKRYMFAEWVMSHFAYKIVGVSDHTSNNLAKYEKISLKKITTIPNGIDLSKYNIKIDKEMKRKELGISTNGPIIGLCVRLTKQKGITYLLQAMPKIIREIPECDVALVIAGKGEFEEQLRIDAISLGIDKNVYFIGPRLDVPELLKLFDLYVLPSLWEGLPVVLIEAMAAGCPIVATDVGGNSMVIVHGENGLLVETRNPEELANAVIKMLKGSNMRDKFIRNSYEIVMSKFTVGIMTKRYEELYIMGLNRVSSKH